MSKIERFIQAIIEADIERIEAARDQVRLEDLAALVEVYWTLDSWDKKYALIELVQDHIDPSTRTIMLDCLKAPADADGDRAELCRAIALCHLQGDLDRFTDYHNDRKLLARTVQQTLADQESPAEETEAPPIEPADTEEGMRRIRALARKGSRRLNRFFYLEVVIGVLLGPLVLIGSLIPAVTDLFGMARSDITIMTVFGGIMTVLSAVAIGDQIVKARRDAVLLAALEGEPGWLVWAYKEARVGRLRRLPFGIGWGAGRFVHVRFCMLDSSESKVWLSVPEAEQLLELVAQHLPHVTCGYSRELEKLYQKDPAALKKSPQRTKGSKELSTTVRY